MKGRRRRGLLRSLLVLAVLAAGGAIAAWLIRTRPTPEARPPPELGALVETAQVAVGPEPLTVEAQGEVVPARRVEVQPQITGEVVWVSEDLEPGGLFEAGEPLFRIDPADYRLGVERAQARVAEARTQLQLERSRKRVAEEEWERLGDELDLGGTERGRRLALREPQLRAARDALQGALAELEGAELQLDRTEVSAPFPAFVQSEAVDPGQLVRPGAPAVALVGTERFWVRASVPVETLAWIAIPGVNAPEGEGSPARIAQDAGDGTIVREGRVVRLLGEVDPAGRMARVLVAVDDPLGLERETKALAGNTSALPLLVGSYVNVAIDAGRLEAAARVPRAALCEGDRVYLYDEGRLEVRDVRIGWRGRDHVLVTGGLAPGERLVTSRLPGAVEGMRLRVESGAEGTSPPAPGEEVRAAGPAGEGPRDEPDRPVAPAVEPDPAPPPAREGP